MRSPPRREFGKPLVNSLLHFQPGGRRVGRRHDARHAGRQPRLRRAGLPKPVFIGDTLRFESECIELRESKSRPNAGIVTWEHRGFNQRGETVCKMQRSALIQKKPAMSEPRSWLFVPADSEKKIAKALDSEADAVIFDLEDSVAPSQKAAARDILKALAASAPAGRNGGCGSIRSAASTTRTI